MAIDVRRTEPYGYRSIGIGWYYNDGGLPHDGYFWHINLWWWNITIG